MKVEIYIFRRIYMKTKQVIFCSLAAVLTVSVSAAAILFARKTRQNMVAADEYTITVGADEFANSELDENYQELVTQDLDGVDAPTLNYYLAKKDSSDNLILAPAGRVYNYSADAGYSGRITNLVSITVNYSGGTLFVQEGIAGDARQYEAKAQLTSGAMFTFATHPNHFMISNSAAETTITSISFKYTCEAAGYSVDRLGTTYNAMGSDGKVYTVTRDGSDVTVNVEDQTFNGTIEVDYQGNFTVNMPALSSGYTGRVSSDYSTLEVTGKTGGVPNVVAFNRVYLVDDFESYANRGHGYSTQASAFTASNLRGEYWIDGGAGTSTSTWISGSGFKMQDDSKNYLNLVTGIKHGGEKAMLLQGQKAGWIRMWNRDVWNQNQQFNLGRGDRLSFWIHSGRNNSDGSGVNSTNVKIRAQVYYQNFVLTDGTRNSTTYGTGIKQTVGCNSSGDLTIATGSGWQEVVINIDPTKTVYGFNIMINNEGFATDYVFMPIDDITISTTPSYDPPKKYEQTESLVTKSYHGTVNVDTVIEGVKEFSVKVAFGANGYVYAYCGVDMVPVDYEISGNTVVIRTTGDYKGFTFGDWTGTISNDRNTITIPKSGIDGGIKSQIESDNITLVQDNVLIEDQDSTTLQSIFKRQHNNSGTWADSDNSGYDTITKNTNYYISGSSATRLKPWGDGHVRMMIKPEVAEAQGIEVESIAFWYYVPANTEYTISLYAYPTYTPKNSGVTQHTDYEMPGGKTHAAGDAGWHYMNVGMPEGFRKNFAIFVQKNAKETIIDYVTYF